MSENTTNAYSYSNTLDTNKTATGAVVDMLTKACASANETSKIHIIEWASEDDNIKKLRDKIKESAST